MKARFLSGFQDDFNSSGILGGNVSTTANFSRATCQQHQMTPIHANEEDQNSDSRKLFTNVKSYANEQEKCS